MVIIPLILLNLQDDGFHLLLEVKIHGQTFRAVLDTGASKSVFDKKAVETHLNAETLQLTDRVSTGLGTTSMESFTMTVPEIQIGELHLINFEVAVLDLSSINYAYEKMEIEPVLGVIGGDILTEYGAIINYRENTLSLDRRR